VSSVAILSNQSFHDTHSTLTIERLPLRLLGLTIAVLLAVTTGIFVISTPHAASLGERLASVATLLGHDHAAHSHEREVGAERSSAHDHDSARNDCGDPTSGSHSSGGPECCNMSTCHAVHTLVAPMLHAPCASGVAVPLLCDEQVAGIAPGGLDRPPRTV
jgi:hypothetical protein